MSADHSPSNQQAMQAPTASLEAIKARWSANDTSYARMDITWLLARLAEANEVARRLTDFAQHLPGCTLTIGAGSEEGTYAVLAPCNCGFDELRQKVISELLRRPAAETSAELSGDQQAALEESTGKMRQRKNRFAVQEGSTPGRLYIDDDDFHWDGALAISGDFESDAEKIRYAEAIAKVLSSHEDEIPYRPADNSAGGN